MKKITFFIGPRQEFLKVLPTEDTMNLTEFVREIELIAKRGSEIKYYEDTNLIVYSDEYTGVNEHFIENFLNYLSFYEFDQLYLHNPPEKIINQFRRSQYGNNIEIIENGHKKVTKDFLKDIKKNFSTRIIGQESVEGDLLATLYPLINESFTKPVVVMFYGPSGIGKTETAKFINSLLNEDKKLFRKQFSMYQNESFSSYLFGDSTTRSSFSKDLLDRESNIILLDEFDKAHPIFHSAFYQMFDEGIFVDKNYKVNLEKAIIICTSNYNSQAEIKKHVGEAIFTRFDSFIKFNPLSSDAKAEIIKQQYIKQLSFFSHDEQQLIEKKKIQEIALRNIDQFTNVREIEKNIRKLMTIPLIENL
ncbi:AAA family ATPase [Bacillus thuringiensis]|uniref:AAA family ATPase n=1 Tax=Bacillus cereus group TaxID=86661 RepID=UPI000F89F76B|nr:AAA family ATPase [Bacillus thuringiensis]AZR76743.1 hypothetical protein BtSCAC15_10190 [Bacillus thuringiensis]MBG9518694.1 hypothetical protein [Bacillus thuringiensis]